MTGRRVARWVAGVAALLIMMGGSVSPAVASTSSGAGSDPGSTGSVAGGGTTDPGGSVGGGATDPGGTTVDPGTSGVPPVAPKTDPVGQKLGEIWAAVCSNPVVRQAGPLEQLACSSVSSVGAMVDSIIGLLNPPPVGKQWLVPYAVCFGLSLVVFAVALMLVTARAADGHKVNGIALLQQAGTRAFFFVPALTALPAGVVAAQLVASNVTSSLMGPAGMQFLDLSREQLVKAADGVLKGGPLATVAGLAGGAIIMFLVVILVLIGFCMMAVEIVLAQLALYVVTCVAPFAVALSLYPAHRGLAAKLFGVLIGLVLVRPAFWLVLWVAGSLMSSTIAAGNLLQTLLTMLVATIVGCAIPALAPMVLSHLVPSHDQQYREPVRRAGEAGKRAVSTGARMIVSG